jgi:hypothetical protein
MDMERKNVGRDLWNSMGWKGRKIKLIEKKESHRGKLFPC